MVVEVEGLRMRYGSTDVLRRRDVPGAAAARWWRCSGRTGRQDHDDRDPRGLPEASAGRVAVLGVDPAHGDEQWRARVGVVLQSWRDHGRWRVRELLAHLGSYYAPYSTPDVPRPWDADELVAAVGLTEQADQEVRRLSGGQRRRLDVAVGVVGRPELLFLDEPTAGFDPQARREFHDLVRAARATSTGRRSCSPPTTSRGREAGGPHPRPRRRPHRRRRHRGRPGAPDRGRGRGALDGAAASGSCGRRRDSTAFVRDLFREHGEDVADLEVRRASLEDTYLALVRRAESGQRVAS